MSEFTPAGSCKDTYGDEIIVERTAGGETAVTFTRCTSGEHFGMILRPQQLAEFRELLDRAVMPGQGHLMEISEDELSDHLSGIVADPQSAAAVVFAELRAERMLAAQQADGVNVTGGL